MTQKFIPNYQVYGESSTATTEQEAMYSERIEDRSSLHNWLIKPHRHHNVYQFFALSKGGVTATVDDQVFKYVAPNLMVLPPFTVHGFKWCKNSSGIVISVLKSELVQILDLMVPKLSIHFSLPILSSQDDLTDFSQLYTLFENFHREYKNNGVEMMLSLRCLLTLTLVEIVRTIILDKTLIADHLSENESKALQFIELVNKHYNEHKGISFYADILGITTTRLNRILQMVLNQSPYEFLANRLVLEAKRNIRYTSMNANQIAYNLGFKDPAYFSRFFKKYTGYTPMKFRNQP